MGDVLVEVDLLLIARLTNSGGHSDREGYLVTSYFTTISVIEMIRSFHWMGRGALGLVSHIGLWLKMHQRPN
jgi:hypothetical protein